LSFFDEADEPRTAPHSAPRRRRTTGGGRRPPSDQQAILVRRAAAIAALVVVIILIAVGVHSCQVDARNSALKDYNGNVVAVIQQSNATGRQFFAVLTGGGSPHNIQTSINEARGSADNELSRAKRFSVPSQVSSAQQHLVLALQMRRDGISHVSGDILQALSGPTSRDAVNAIATEMARFYASDVLYKSYTVPIVLGALKAAGIAIGGANGQPVESGQFLPDIRWVQPSFVAAQLHVGYSGTTSGKVAPGLHGHALTSVSVAGTTLQTGSTNTLPRTPPPTFTLSFSNTGQNTETNVVCKVTISGSSVQGHTTVPQTTAGQQTSCDVPLDATPPLGSVTVTAQIVPVPGEKNKANNSLSFPVTFSR
jgi:hypothetical protein